MSSADPTGAAARAVAEGAWRVARFPALLPKPGRSPKHRFDDPEKEFSLRYTGDTLYIGLVECMAQFRGDEETERLIATMGEDLDERHVREQAIADWLAEQSMVLVRLVERADFVDVYDPGVLTELVKHDRVWAEWVKIRGRLGVPRLEAAAVLLGEPISRPLTQAISRVVYDIQPAAAGIAYLSHHDIRHRCWGIYDRTTVELCDEQKLNPGNPDHRRAVQEAATALTLPLPPAWF